MFEPLGIGFIHVHPPYCYRCPFDQRYPSCGRTCVELIERTIEAEDPQTVAAVIVEPISISVGRVRRAAAGLSASGCARSATATTCVLIYDEIITGFGRLGTMFASEYFGAAPDITCCGKGMSGGYAPLAAILIRDRIAARLLWRATRITCSSTMATPIGGNPIACAAGIAVLNEILERDVVGNARAPGRAPAPPADRAGRALRPHRRRPRGRAAAGHRAGPRPGHQGDRFPGRDRPGKAIEREARQRGLLLRCGNDFAAFAPPLTVTDDEIDEMTALLDPSIVAAVRELAA